MRLSAIVSLASLVLTTPALAIEYPCPSDPGFCYRDVGDDGCFDSGVDEGPIDAEIEGSSALPASPPPGSIVCPPSVGALTAGNEDIRLAVPSSSSVLFYAATITLGDLEIVSGDEILLGGQVLRRGGSTSLSAALSAEGDIRIEKGMKLNGPAAGTIFVKSASGSVTVGPRVMLKAARIDIEAEAGDVFFLESSGTIATVDVDVIADGVLDMVRPKLAHGYGLHLRGANLTIHEKATLKGEKTGSGQVVISAGNDLRIDALSLSIAGRVYIGGDTVTIGSRTKSTLTLTYGTSPSWLRLSATGAIRLERVHLKTEGFDDEVMGSILSYVGPISVLGSRFYGIDEPPIYEIAVDQPGSACDLTGTVVLNGTLSTDCSTVIGP